MLIVQQPMETQLWVSDSRTERGSRHLSAVRPSWLLSPGATTEPGTPQPPRSSRLWGPPGHAVSAAVEGSSVLWGLQGSPRAWKSPRAGPRQQGELRAAGELGSKGSRPGRGGQSPGWSVESDLVTGHLDTLTGRPAGESRGQRQGRTARPTPGPAEPG